MHAVGGHAAALQWRRCDDESEAALQAVIGPETEEADAMSEGRSAQAVTDFLTRFRRNASPGYSAPAAPPQEFSDEYWDNLSTRRRPKDWLKGALVTVAENAIVVNKNIWLDFYLHERPLHEEAARFIRVAEKYNANLGTPADAVNEVFTPLGSF